MSRSRKAAPRVAAFLLAGSVAAGAFAAAGTAYANPEDRFDSPSVSQTNPFDPSLEGNAETTAGIEALVAAGVGAEISSDPAVVASKITIPSGTDKHKFLSYAAAQAGQWYSWGQGGPEGPTQGTPDSARTDASGDAWRFGDGHKSGFDCAGLISAAFSHSYGGSWKSSAAEFLAHLQGREGVTAVGADPAQAQQGDLIFYEKNGTIVHVAIAMDGKTVLEAPSSGTKVSLRNERLQSPMQSPNSTTTAPPSGAKVIQVLRLPDTGPLA